MRKILVAALAVLGCGNDNVHHLDDGGADAAQTVDAPAVDAAPTPGVVTVTVTLAGDPSAGNTVYFQNADSSLVAEVMTDGSGVASATMAPGGFVTVVEPLPPVSLVPDGQTLSTFSDVKPGDQLRDDVFSISTINDVDTFAITVPTDPNPAAVTYTLDTTCGQGDADITPPVTLRRAAAPHAAIANNPPVQVTLASCNGRADMVVFTEDAKEQLLDAFFIPNIAISDGSAVTLTGTYAPFASTPVAFTDVPAEFVDGDVELQVTGPHGSVDGFGFGTSFDFDGGSGSGAISLPSGFTGATAVTLDQVFPSGNLIDEQVQATFGAIPASITSDVGAFRLRSWVTFPQVDPAAEAVEWAVAKDGKTPDYVLARVRADRSDPAHETEDSWTWSIAAPGTSDGHLSYPVLPTDVFDFNFHDTDDQLFVEELVGVQSAGGYDAARALVFDTIEQLFDPEVLPSSTATFVVQEDEEEGLRARAKAKARRGAGHLSVNGRAVRSAAPAAR
jgi:hypothetical protein|nr:hypothetical protein [Kofleriaceae bacterium]